MARPQKVSSDKKIDIVKLYVLEECKGDTRCIRYANIAQFAQNKGYDLKEYDFRRDEEVKQYLSSLDQGNPMILNGVAMMPAYHQLDPEALSGSKGKDLQYLHDLIRKLNSQCIQYSDKTMGLQSALLLEQNENKRLQQEMTLRLQRENEKQKEKEKETIFGEDRCIDYIRRDRDELKSENAALHNFISSFIMKDIAVLLLQEKNLHCGTIHVLNKDSLARLTDGVYVYTPSSTDTPAGSSPDPTSDPDTDSQPTFTESETDKTNTPSPEATSVPDNEEVNCPVDNSTPGFIQLTMEDVLREMEKTTKRAVNE